MSTNDPNAMPPSGAAGATATEQATVMVPTGSVYDAATGLYVDPASGAYFDPSAGRYLTAEEVRAHMTRIQQQQAAASQTGSSSKIGWGTAIVVAILAFVGFGLFLNERQANEDLEQNIEQVQSDTEQGLNDLQSQLSQEQEERDQAAQDAADAADEARDAADEEASTPPPAEETPDDTSGSGTDDTTEQ